jgi:hypothetical protein
MSTRAIALLAIQVVLSVLLGSELAEAASLHQGDRVVLMGDSEAFLLSWEFPKLAQASGVQFSSVVVPGSSVISWARELDSSWSKVRRAKADVLLVSLGANDACTGPRVVRNEGPFLRSFQTKLRRTRAKCVIWLGPPAIGAPNPTRTQCSKALAEPGLELFFQMVQKAGLPYLDARTVPIHLWGDHLHCSRPMHQGDKSRGCDTWARWIWQRITTEDFCEVTK